MCDFRSFPNFGTILFWPISLLIISSGSSGLFTFGCFNYVFLKVYHVTSLEKAPSKFLAYIKNTIPARSLWPPSEESPPPLPLFQCCYNDVDFSFDIFLNLQNNIGHGVWGKRKPLSNVIVWDCRTTFTFLGNFWATNRYKTDPNYQSKGPMSYVIRFHLCRSLVCLSDIFACL